MSDAPCQDFRSNGFYTPRVRHPLQRHFTKAGADPLKQVRYVQGSSRIEDTDGTVIFEMKGIEVPADWSQLAVDILVSKYFRKSGVPKTRRETSVRQVIRRITRTIRDFGVGRKYFNKADARVFEDELSHLLIHQMGAFNSPVWFNLGLFHEYGIRGSGGNFLWNPIKKRADETLNSYEHPQCSACFIQSVDDDLMSIFQLAKNEARVFKHGSGTGTNFSRLRGGQEKLSGGGTSSGLMSFLEVLDRGAGAIKSGGTTRRAAKMVCLDADHPEIVDFITWKAREEKKVALLIAGGYSADFNGEAYHTIAGQNSNNSVRVTDRFMQAVEEGGKWQTRARLDGEVVDTYEARDLWRKIAETAWACADPGVQYDTTINRWHTCSATGPIRASNPCSEFMFLDDTACNLASLNLVKFQQSQQSGEGFDIEGFRHACRIFILAQDILVDLSSYPTAGIARNSHDFRPLGLGYANLGTFLMLKGVPYDSDEGRAWAGAITAIMSGHAYAASAESAAQLGPFAGYRANRAPMLKVIAKHRAEATKLRKSGVLPALTKAALEDWDRALKLGHKHGFRNSQVTVLAPTGTIGLLMDCDTTGIEPDFSLVKFKKLAGGGTFKIVNASVPEALRNLDYSPAETVAILRHLDAKMTVEGAPGLKSEHLAVFDCANRCGPMGRRFIAPRGHLRMMAAAQPFLSGAISKTVNLPSESTIEDVEAIYREGWKLGLKAVAIYRDSSKLSQPLSTKSTRDEVAAPNCDACDHATVPSGSCFKCLNCGETTGCS